MAEKIFLIQPDNSLVTVSQSEFVSEDVFQELLATHPSLLAGDQLGTSEPRKWLLVTREMGVPDSDSGSSRWSLDHLYLDQEGVPTLVEVKRSSDTRLRREVVGQMLDYAANAIVYWPANEIRHQFVLRCEQDGLDPDHEIRQFLEDDGVDSETFWESVKTNLQAKRVRLLFVADDIPRELRRIIEFLNEQMDPAEVLGLELKHHSGSGIRVLVPAVVGRTETAASRKDPGHRASRRWDQESILNEIERKVGAECRSLAADFLVSCENLVDRLEYGQGTQDGSCSAVIDIREGGKAVKYPIVYLWTTPTIAINLTKLKSHSAFAVPETKQALEESIASLPGVRFTPTGQSAYMSLDKDSADVTFSAVQSFVSWLVAQIRKTDVGAAATGTDR